MYLCIIPTSNTHHDDTTTYLTHNLGRLRLRDAGAGPVWSSRPTPGTSARSRETDGRVSHTFTGENRGDKPVVILDVVTTCGCTVPEFTKRPIRPGRENDNQSNVRPDQPPRRLHQGAGRLLLRADARSPRSPCAATVTPRTKTTEELYPVDAGGGLRLASTLSAFSYIREGRQVQSAIG